MAIKRESLFNELQEGFEFLEAQRLNIDEGIIFIQCPCNMGLESFEDFTDWLVLLHRRIGRRVVSKNGRKPRLAQSRY